MTRAFDRFALCALAFLSLPLAAGAADAARTLNVLFIGNSFTARHNLSTVVKAMAEAGNPGLTFNRTDVIYGGRTFERSLAARYSEHRQAVNPH